MVTLVNYGLGNIQAFYHIYTRLNLPVTIASTPEQLSQAEKIILPGVGAFDWAMTRLNHSGMREILDHLVINQKVPVLGICVGMQIMASCSEEGTMEGLGWIHGDVKKLDIGSEEQGVRRELALPHMGWNHVNPVRENLLFAGMSDPRFYFLHSYCFLTSQVCNILATTNYGRQFTAAVSDKHIYGVQFHPEKSHGWGIQLLKNFAEI